MLDEIIGHTTESFEIPRDSELDPIETRADYLHKSNGASFRPFYDFYQGQHLHVTGLSHTEAGFPTTQPAAVQRGIEHLVYKIDNHQTELERNEEYLLKDADIAVITWGSPGRASRQAVDDARAKGIKAGMFRPITFWPFPTNTVRDLVDRVRAVVVPEMNMGMLKSEVERSAMRRDVKLHGVNVVGGIPIEPHQVLKAIEEANRGF